MRSSFGHLMSEKDNDRLEEVYGLFEFTYLILLFVVYIVWEYFYSRLSNYIRKVLAIELYSNMVYVVLFINRFSSKF